MRLVRLLCSCSRSLERGQRQGCTCTGAKPVGGSYCDRDGRRQLVASVTLRVRAPHPVVGPSFSLVPTAAAHSVSDLSLEIHTLCCHAAIQACLVAWTYLHRSDTLLGLTSIETASEKHTIAPPFTLQAWPWRKKLRPATCCRGAQRLPTRWLTLSDRSPIKICLGLGTKSSKLMPEVNDTAAVPPVPVLQQTLGKSTAGFAGSGPPVLFRGRPPGSPSGSGL
jgi:hypothetical protein